MTASPYHQGTNDKASDKALFYNMNVNLAQKKRPEKSPSMTLKFAWIWTTRSSSIGGNRRNTRSYRYLHAQWLFASTQFCYLYVSGCENQGLWRPHDQRNYYQIEATKTLLIGSTVVAVVHRPYQTARNQAAGPMERLLRRGFLTSEPCQMDWLRLA